MPRFTYVVAPAAKQAAQDLLAQHLPNVTDVEFIQLLTELNLLEVMRWDLHTNRVSPAGATDLQLSAIAVALAVMVMGGKQIQPEAPV